ncbi:MaoC family dehydratase [Mycobacterium marseillense]|nr:MaoC family dehydratase [Mycobacterium marseillense]
MVYDGIADFETHVGEHLGFSDWRQVTQKEIDLFAEATGDHQWIHVDPEKAAAGPYGKTIAHGYLTLSLVPILVQQIYRVTGLAMQVNYGSDKLRFPAPVPVDSRIRAGAELVKVERNDKGGRATVRVTVEVEGSDRPACVVDTIAAMVDA